MKNRPCGNPECCVSTFIDGETLTFGTGKLDGIGCWENPCEICEEDYHNKIKLEKLENNKHSYV